MKSKILVLMLSLCMTAAFAQNASLPPNDWEAKFEKLQDEVQMQRRELELKIKEAQQKPDNGVFYGVIVALVIAFVSGPASVLVGSRIEKKKLTEKVALNTNQYLDEKLEGMVKPIALEYINKNVPALVESVIDSSRLHEENIKMRQTCKILIVAEDEDEAAKRKTELHKSGYLNTITTSPKEYADFPDHDVCFIEHPEAEDSYEKLSNAYIQKIIQALSNEDDESRGMFFHVPFQYQGLSFHIVKQRNFANSPGTIDDNLLKLIRQLQKNEQSNG